MDAIADRTDEEKKLLEERKQLLVAAYVDELDKKSSFYSDIIEFRPHYSSGGCRGIYTSFPFNLSMIKPKIAFIHLFLL